MKKGDVLFYKGTSLISKLITWVTKSPYTHVALVIGDGEIIESDRFIKTRRIEIDLTEPFDVYTVENLSDETREEIVKYALEFVGTKYDYWQIFRDFIRFVFNKKVSFFEFKNKTVCSDIIDLPYYKANVPRKPIYTIGDVSPGELLDAYPFSKEA